MNLSTPEKNLIAKLQDNYGLVVSENETTVTNLCTGQSFNSTPLVAALVNFLNVSYRNYNLFGKMYFNNKPVAIGTYDRTKYLILKLDSDTYYNVID